MGSWLAWRALERALGSGRAQGRRCGRGSRRLLRARGNCFGGHPFGHGAWGFNTQGIGATNAYVPDSLASAILQDPRQKFDVIVEGVKTPQDASQTGVTPAGLRGGILGIHRGANTIGGSQIGALFQSINGLHATLTGFQIRFLARLPYVAAIMPNEPVQMSSYGSTASNSQKWAWTIGAPVDWMPQAGQLNTPDDRDHRLRHRREPFATSPIACSDR